MPLNTIPNEGLTSRGYPSDRLVTPIIINGDMSVAQRGTSVTSQTGSGYLTVDRVRLGTGANCTFTVTQASEAPTGQGFSKSYKLVATTGDATLANAEYNLLQYRCEGNTLQAIKKGTSNAEKITFAFWVKASVTGTYILELIDNDNSRYISKAYTISAADTWEKKIIVIDADTTGAFDNDSNKSLTIDFWLGAGNDYSSGTLQTAWTSNTSANRAVGQVNAFASNNDAWQITGLQIEVGEFDSTTIPSFPFESFENNLRKCQRYYFCSDTVSSATEFHPCFCGSSGNTPDSIKFIAPVPFRSPDNVTITASAGTSQLVGGGYSSTTTVPTFTRRSLTNDVDGTTKPSGNGTKIYFVTNALFSGISEGFAGFGTTGKLEFDNEL
tara:strand:- start:76 stop:1227 length:1152 start_codon:yes stop_codon:yes gene_type:complete